MFGSIMYFGKEEGGNLRSQGRNYCLTVDYSSAMSCLAIWFGAAPALSLVHKNTAGGSLKLLSYCPATIE